MKKSVYNKTSAFLVLLVSAYAWHQLDQTGCIIEPKNKFLACGEVGIAVASILTLMAVALITNAYGLWGSAREQDKSSGGKNGP